jgi:hypothetical protein
MKLLYQYDSRLSYYICVLLLYSKECIVPACGLPKLSYLWMTDISSVCPPSLLCIRQHPLPPPHVSPYLLWSLRMAATHAHASQLIRPLTQIWNIWANWPSWNLDIIVRQHILKRPELMVVVDDEYFNGASFRRGIGGGGGRQSSHLSSDQTLFS